MNPLEIKMKQIRHRSVKLRSQSGVGIIAIGLFLAFFAVLPLSLFYFEMARFGLMQQELHNITDFAALSGTAALASSQQSGGTGQTIAMKQAVWTFSQNGILQTTFGPPPTLYDYSQINANTGQWNNIYYSLNQSTPHAPPTTPKTVVLNVTLRDQAGGPQPTGSSTAVTMAVAAMYMDTTVFASQILPIEKNVTAAAFSLGGLPQLDMILCFDISSSMDDGTSVFLERRCWDKSIPTAKVKCYQVQTLQNHEVPAVTHTTPDTIYNIFQPIYTGTSLNIVPPQGLRFGSYKVGYNGLTLSQGAVANPYFFTELSVDPNYWPAAGPYNTLRALLSAAPPPAQQTLTGVAEQGCPPGNQSSGTFQGFMSDNTTDPNNTSSSPGMYYFTDIIPSALVGQTVGSFNFATEAICVEASRGNLENNACYTNSGANTDCPGVSVGTGWYTAYWTWVRNNAQPISIARTAAVGFFQTMNSSSNAHFGLVTFATNIGSNQSTTVAAKNIDGSCWAAGGSNNFPLPLVSLDQNNSNFGSSGIDVTGVITGTGGLPVGPIGATDIYDALVSAVGQLTTPSQTRSAARKAIILFTDGAPNEPSNQSYPDYGSWSEASTSGGDNIPIFTIGLSQNTAVKPYEIEVLGDGNETGSGWPTTPNQSKGIAFKSGGIFFPVNNSTDLYAAFQAVARSLVVLQ